MRGAVPLSESPWSPPVLATALRSIDPRAARLLRWRVLEARSPGECAQALGVGRPSVDLALARAMRLLASELEPGVPGVLPADQEQQEAAGLREALEAGTGAAPAGAQARLDPHLLRLTGALLRAPGQVLDALERAEQAELASPAARRENVLRKTALLALVAAALYLYLTGRGPFGQTPASPSPAPQRAHP